MCFEVVGKMYPDIDISDILYELDFSIQAGGADRSWNWTQ